MKKKLVIVSLICILCTLIVGSTLAYFQSSDEVENVFSYGSIKVTQFEQEHDEEGNLVDFTQGQYLYPIINVNDPSSDQYYIEKLVSLKNTGSNEAYVRSFIAVPNVLKDVVKLDIDNSKDWLKDSKSDVVVIEGIEYFVTSYTYHKSIVKNETTSYVLNGVYLDSSVDLQMNGNEKQFCVDNGNGYTFFDYDVNNPIHVYVVSQACQVNGLGNDPQNALNQAFGQVTPNFN